MDIQLSDCVHDLQLYLASSSQFFGTTADSTLGRGNHALSLGCGAVAWFTSRYIPELIAQGNNLFTLLSHEGGLDVSSIMQLPFVNGIYEYAQQLDAQDSRLEMPAAGCWR
jgi:hypothetical protein